MKHDSHFASPDFGFIALKRFPDYTDYTDYTDLSLSAGLQNGEDMDFEKKHWLLPYSNNKSLLKENDNICFHFSSITLIEMIRYKYVLSYYYLSFID